MIYCDKEKYLEAHSELTGEEAETLLEKAQDSVDLMTGSKISGTGFSFFPERTRELIEKAVFSEADRILKNGFAEDASGGGEPVSVSLGSFSYSYGTSSAAAAAASERESFSGSAVKYLEAAGLLSRSIGVV